MKKYLYLLVIGLVLALKLNDNNTIIEKEIELNKISYLLLGYDSDILVGDIDIDVFDYYIENNQLVVKPLGSRVILPISGIISEINKDYIVIDSLDNKYYIYGLDKTNFLLYQYYYHNQVLGEASIYKIVCDDLSDVVAWYKINYEII